MDTEFRAMVANDKKAAGAKVTEYREEYRQILENFRNTRSKAESAALKSGSGARDKLINANQRLDHSTATLEQSRMLVAQSEQIGTGIATDLQRQKETLVSAKEKVQETKAFTTDAKGILQIMGRRNVYHKIIMMVIIICLFGAICATFYYGFIANKK